MKIQLAIRHRRSEIQDRNSPGKHYPFTAGLLCLICLAWLLPSGVVSATKVEDTDNVDQIENTRAALEKWVETQRIISQEKRDLALAREMLTERIELMQREVESLQGKISQSEASIAETDKKRADMMEENEELKDASASLGGTLLALEDRTKQLLHRLPDPICERVKPLSQRLPEKGKQTKLSVAERFQNVVGILNEVNKFNRDITVTSEVRVLPDGTSAEVTTLYVGIAQAYYVGAKGSLSGIGTASDGGWAWKPANAAAQTAQAIAILKNEQVASFVQLPIEIQ